MEDKNINKFLLQFLAHGHKTLTVTFSGEIGDDTRVFQMTDFKSELRKILFNWHKWRDYYYSDLEEEVITEGEWTETRDKIDSKTIDDIIALFISKVVGEDIDLVSLKPLPNIQMQALGRNIEKNRIRRFLSSGIKGEIE